MSEDLTPEQRAAIAKTTAELLAQRKREGRTAEYRGTTWDGEPKYGNTFDGVVGPLSGFVNYVKEHSGSNLEVNLNSVEGPNILTSAPRGDLRERAIETTSTEAPNIPVAKIKTNNLFGF